MSPGTSKKPSREPAKKTEVDKDLNEALKATFPASDPFMVGEPTGTEGPVPPGAPLPKPKRPASSEKSKRGKSN